MKRALITGITGQDGCYLARFLLDKGYEVHGICRRASTPNLGRLTELLPNIQLHYADMTDALSLTRVLTLSEPDEIYNLAAQSHVAVSFDIPVYTAQADALGVVHLLEAIRVLKMTDRVRFYQASSSELFGNACEVPQRETTPFAPRSPYAIAKLYAYWMTVNYRQAYGLFAANGILFNHESPQRGHTFVTQKIARAIAQIAHACSTRSTFVPLALGNLDARRDWGYAGDYVDAMWRIVQHHTADDFVIATGQWHSVREFVEKACAHVGITLVWTGSGLDETGIDSETGRVIVTVDAQYFRPTEVDSLLGDATKARTLLGWQPTMSFDALVAHMVDSAIDSEHMLCERIQTTQEENRTTW